MYSIKVTNRVFLCDFHSSWVKLTYSAWLSWLLTLAFSWRRTKLDTHISLFKNRNKANGTVAWLWEVGLTCQSILIQVIVWIYYQIEHANGKDNLQMQMFLLMWLFSPLGDCILKQNKPLGVTGLDATSHTGPLTLWVIGYSLVQCCSCIASSLVLSIYSVLSFSHFITFLLCLLS